MFYNGNSHKWNFKARVDIMIYLDNCATTKIREQVLEKIYKSLEEDFGNPSSLHGLGLNAEKKIKKARRIIAEFLDVKEGEIYFTSGATESNNIAIQSVVNKYSSRGKHIITSKIEHPSVLNTMKYLEEKGFRITYLEVDGQGKVDLDQLREALDEETILLSIIHVNNEIGTIQDLKKIRSILNMKNPNTIFHVDGVQSFGKIPFSIRDLSIDLFSFSGHKIHGPKGIGGLFIKDKLNLNPIVYGGDQELGMRSGTENLTGIIAMGEAVRILGEKENEEFKKIKSLKDYTVKKIQGAIPNIKINSPCEEGFSPYVLNISFMGTRGQILLHYLEDKEIYVSTTSACSSKGTAKSHVLKAIGLKDEEIEGAIRIGFSYEIEEEDIDYLLEILKISVGEIRKIIMR